MLLTETQIYALFFIIGCFSVKSLLDLKNWAARKHLWELWIILTITMVGHDFILRPSSLSFLLIKWLSIGAISLFFYFKEIRFMILDDKLAFLAAVSLIHLFMVPIFLLIFILLLLVLRTRIKHGFSLSKRIPTLPLSTTSLVFTVIIFLFA